MNAPANPRPVILALAVVVALPALNACGGEPTGQAPAVDGRLEAGLRVLTFDPAATDQAFTVHRGDYVRPELAGGGAFTLEIPALDVRLDVPTPDGERPYVKLPDAGTFAFRIGEAGGTLTALEYAAPAYREISAREAAALLDQLDPVVLDVRTPREFTQGRLAGAELVPVQVLQGRLDELADRRDQPVFVYCRTGNRSTVAAKLLVDAGHTRVINLRRGIVEWQREDLPVVR